MRNAQSNASLFSHFLRVLRNLLVRSLPIFFLLMMGSGVVIVWFGAVEILKAQYCASPGFTIFSLLIAFTTTLFYCLAIFAVVFRKRLLEWLSQLLQQRRGKYRRMILLRWLERILR